jgi:transposase-like protein
VINSRSVSSAPAGYRFPREVIAVAVRWYLRYGLSYRDVEELLAERGIEVDHVTVYRWVQTFTPAFISSARPARHATGDRWFVDETYLKVAGRWSYLYRAIDQHGQVIDVLVSERRSALLRGRSSPRTHLRSCSGRDHHGPGTGLSARDRRSRPGRTARQLAVCYG